MRVAFCSVACFGKKISQKPEGSTRVGVVELLLLPGRSAPEPLSSQGSWGHVTAGRPRRGPHLDLGCPVQARSRDEGKPSWRRRQELGGPCPGPRGRPLQRPRVGLRLYAGPLPGSAAFLQTEHVPRHPFNTPLSDQLGQGRLESRAWPIRGKQPPPLPEDAPPATPCWCPACGLLRHIQLFPASPAFWTAKPEAGSPSGPQDLGKGWGLQAPAEPHGDPTSGSGDPRAGVTLGEDHTGFSRCPPSLVSRGAQPRSGRRPQGGYEGREQPEPSRTAGAGRVSCHVALEHGPTARSEPGSP